MSARHHVPPIEDPLVPERSLADEIAPQVGDRAPHPGARGRAGRRADLSTVATESQSYVAWSGGGSASRCPG